MRIGLKILTVLALTAAMLPPLGQINDTASDRQRHRQQAVETVSRSTAGAQTVAGPVLYVPWTRRILVTRVDAAGVERREPREESGTWTFFPTTLHAAGTLRPTPRRLGLHEVRIYELDARLRATFSVQIPGDDDPAAPRRIGRPQLGIAIGDVRGLVGLPSLKLDGRPLRLEQGLGGQAGSGVHANLVSPAAGSTLRFDAELAIALQGTETLSIVPLAGSNVIELKSSWPHPRFTGDFLPRTRTIGAQGFGAQWEISSLATSAQARFTPGGRGSEGRAPLEAVSVSLVDPVDVYTQVDRATKYGLLFVLLTFVAFFMFEFLRQLRVHPIQYVLVGLAIASFFLLLLALSEHVAFGVAYLAAAVACVGLVGYYLRHVLAGWRRGAGMAAMLGTLYAALYGLLISEDNALVLGAVLLFVILAAIMVLTRKVDWYRAAAGDSLGPNGNPPGVT